MRIGLIRWESIITSRPECRGRIPVILINPLSRFPQGGKAGCGAPSPLGEGWEGGINNKNLEFHTSTQKRTKIK